MQIIKHRVVYKLPKQLQWEQDFPTKDNAIAFITEVEAEGGVAVYIEHYEQDNIEIGATPVDEDEDNG